MVARSQSIFGFHMRGCRGRQGLGIKFVGRGVRIRSPFKGSIERAPLTKFLVKMACPAMLAYLINGNDVRVIQARGIFSFRPNSLRCTRVVDGSVLTTFN